jgi:hypothetical protein
MSLDLSFQEVEELLERVINNAHLAELELDRPKKCFVVFSSPSAKHILKSRSIRLRALTEAEQEGLPSLEEVVELIETRGIISSEDKAKIKELEDKITAQRRVLQLTKIEGRRKPILETIDRLEDGVYVINAKGDYYRTMSREYKADEEAILYLAWAATNNIDGTRQWPTFEDFENETDLSFREAVIREFAKFNRGLTAEQVRYLARHTLWRIRYTAALKIGGSLFVRGLEDLTPDQQALLFWSNHYQSIYDMLPDDRPDDDTIDDDKALDSYMEAYFKRVEAERNVSRLKRHSRGKGRLSASEKEEVIITQAHPEYMKMAYSEERVQASDGAAEVEVVSPNSRRARNRRAARRRS